MTRSRKSLMLAILLAFLVAAPAHAQRSSSASHTVTIQVLPAANVDADDFIAFGMSVLGDASETRTAEAHTCLPACRCARAQCCAWQRAGAAPGKPSAPVAARPVHPRS